MEYKTGDQIIYKQFGTIKKIIKAKSNTYYIIRVKNKDIKCEHKEISYEKN